MKRSAAVLAALVVVAASLTAHILTRTNKRERTTASPKYIFAIVPTSLEANQWHLTYSRRLGLRKISGSWISARATGR